MAYIDAQDIRQHVRGAQSVPVPNINETMEEVESMVAAELDLGDSLPAGKPVLRAIVRELTTARVILDLLPPTSENVARTQLHDQRGWQMLRSAKKEGIDSNSYADRSYESEVYNPRTTSFWSSDMFDPNQLPG
jgi:hypothetical protein